MSLLEIIKKLHLIDIKNYFQDFLKIDYHPTKIIIDKLMINTLDELTPEQFEEVKEKSLETAEEISKEIKKASELPQHFKEIIAKTIVTGTILTNLSNLRQKISKGLIKLNPNTDVILLIRCDKCGKFFNAGIGGNIQSLLSSTFINNIHQCQYCRNMQLVKDDSDYFVSL